MSRMHMQRPRSIYRMSLVLTLIGVSALGGIVGTPWGQPLPVAPQLLRADPRTASWLIFMAAVIYCVATLICAFALWRMRPWTPTAYRWFVASILFYMLLFLYLVRIPAPIGLAVTFFGLLGAALYWGWRIVRTAFPSDQRAL